MKKLTALLVALLLALTLLTPALADAADAAAEVAEAAAETAAETAADAAEAAADTAETATETVTEATADAAEAAAETVTEAAADAVETAADAAEATADAAEAEAEAAAEAAEAAPAVSPVFKKLLEVPWYVWVVIALLVVCAVVLSLAGRNAKWSSRRISMGAMCIAISFVLSCIRLFRMPQGGSITPASTLPLVIFMVACGPLQGFVAGCAYGLLHLVNGGYVIHPLQLLVDYPLTYGAMILACLVTLIKVDDRWKLPIAVLLAGIGRYAMAVLSGTVFFGDYAPEGQSALIYSLVYNISYLGPDTLVCMIIACIPGMPRLLNMIRKNR